MGRDGPEVPPLVLAVERILADEEREGGHTARSLAAVIVRSVLNNLSGQSVDVVGEIVGQIDHLLAQSEHVIVGEGAL